MSMQASSDICKKCWLYLISLRHLLVLHLDLDLKLKFLWGSCGIVILSDQQIHLFLFLYAQNDFKMLYKESKICNFMYIYDNEIVVYTN